jgi:hypothetical protein
MKGDFTRNTFNPRKHFSRVLLQQGRVQLDADFNEQAAILLRYLQTFAADLIGPFGGPAHDLGFAILSDPAQVSKLSEAEQEGLKSDAESLKLLFGKLKKNAFDFLITKGRYYVDGVLCENDDYAIYSQQANYAQELLQQLKPPYLFYLDVWERHITYVEDDQIREVALGGADTATRAKVEWQIKFWPASEGDRDKPPSKLTRDDVLKGWRDWEELFQPANRGLLKARVKSAEGATEPCIIRPEARFRGAENQLYRVEVHQGGAAGAATFKWSRENGSVAFPIVRASGASVTLAHLGRDHRLGLKVNDWVEFVDDDIALRNQAGALFQVAEIEPIDFTVTLKVGDGTSVPTYDENSTKHPLLRRWDHQGDKNKGGAVAISESNQSWLTLEDNVQIQFQEGGNYRTGDYWLIPARTATGNIEWPYEKGSDGNVNLDKEGKTIPLALPPQGVEHHYAPLAIITGGSAGGRGKKDRAAEATGTEQIEDCRSTFDSLSRPTG